MPLAGPRPAVPREAEMFGTAHRRRFLVPPGMTGPWQVSGRNSLTMLQGLGLDPEYADRQCFTPGLAILLRTVPVALSMAGAR